MHSQAGFLDLDCGGVDLDCGDSACDALEFADCCDCGGWSSGSRSGARGRSGKLIHVPPARRHEAFAPTRSRTDTDMPSPIDAVAAREIISMRLIDAPRDQVYQVYTDPRTLPRWWGPAHVANSLHEFDLKPGGHWRFVMRGPDGVDCESHSVFVDVHPGERLVFDHLSPPRCRASIHFGERGNKTLVRVRLLFETAANCEAVKAFAVDANEKNLDRLEALVKGA